MSKVRLDCVALEVDLHKCQAENGSNVASWKHTEATLKQTKGRLIQAETISKHTEMTLMQLRKDHRNKTKELSELHAAYALLAKSALAEKLAMNAATTRFKELKKEIAFASSQSCKKTEARFIRTQANLNEAQAKLAHTEVCLNETEVLLVQLRKKCDGSSAELSKVTYTLAQVTKTAETEKLAASNAASRISELEKQLNDAVAEHNEQTEVSLAQLRKQHDSKTDELAKLQVAFEKVTQAALTEKSAACKATLRVHELEEQLVDVTAAFDKRMESTLKDTHATLDQTKDTLAQTEASLLQLRQELKIKSDALLNLHTVYIQATKTVQMGNMESLNADSRIKELEKNLCNATTALEKQTEATSKPSEVSLEQTKARLNETELLLAKLRKEYDSKSDELSNATAALAQLTKSTPSEKACMGNPAPRIMELEAQLANAISKSDSQAKASVKQTEAVLEQTKAKLNESEASLLQLRKECDIKTEELSKVTTALEEGEKTVQTETLAKGNAISQIKELEKQLVDVTAEAGVIQLQSNAWSRACKSAFDELSLVARTNSSHSDSSPVVQLQLIKQSCLDWREKRQKSVEEHDTLVDTFKLEQTKVLKLITQLETQFSSSSEECEATSNAKPIIPYSASMSVIERSVKDLQRNVDKLKSDNFMWREKHGKISSEKEEDAAKYSADILKMKQNIAKLEEQSAELRKCKARVMDDKEDAPKSGEGSSQEIEQTVAALRSKSNSWREKYEKAINHTPDRFEQSPLRSRTAELMSPAPLDKRSRLDNPSLESRLTENLNFALWEEEHGENINEITPINYSARLGCNARKPSVPLPKLKGASSTAGSSKKESVCKEGQSPTRNLTSPSMIGKERKERVHGLRPSLKRAIPIAQSEQDGDVKRARNGGNYKNVGHKDERKSNGHGTGKSEGQEIGRRVRGSNSANELTQPNTRQHTGTVGRDKKTSLASCAREAHDDTCNYKKLARRNVSSSSQGIGLIGVRRKGNRAAQSWATNPTVVAALMVDAKHERVDSENAGPSSRNKMVKEQSTGEYLDEIEELPETKKQMKGSSVKDHRKSLGRRKNGIARDGTNATDDSIGENSNGAQTNLTRRVLRPRRLVSYDYEDGRDIVPGTRGDSLSGHERVSNTNGSTDKSNLKPSIGITRTRIGVRSNGIVNAGRTGKGLGRPRKDATRLAVRKTLARMAKASGGGNNGNVKDGRRRPGEKSK